MRYSTQTPIQKNIDSGIAVGGSRNPNVGVSMLYVFQTSHNPWSASKY